MGIATEDDCNNSICSGSQSVASRQSDLSSLTGSRLGRGLFYGSQQLLVLQLRFALFQKTGNLTLFPSLLRMMKTLIELSRQDSTLVLVTYIILLFICLSLELK